VLGRTGRNFAAGMSGGIAYVFDADDVFGGRCNRDMVELERLDEAEDIDLVREMLRRHVRYTRSTLAANLLANWDDARDRFVKVIPRDYKRILVAEARARAQAREPEFSELVAVVNA
jgi:glutamate synthase domain-containing protein 3